MVVIARRRRGDRGAAGASGAVSAPPAPARALSGIRLRRSAPGASCTMPARCCASAESARSRGRLRRRCAGVPAPVGAQARRPAGGAAPARAGRRQAGRRPAPVRPSACAARLPGGRGEMVTVRFFTLRARGCAPQAWCGRAHGEFEVAFPVRRLGMHQARPRTRRLRRSGRSGGTSAASRRAAAPPVRRSARRGARAAAPAGAAGLRRERAGVFDARTARAVLAFRKVTGMARVPVICLRASSSLARGAGGFQIRRPRHGRHIEADLSRQVLALIERRAGRRIYPISSGRAGDADRARARSASTSRRPARTPRAWCTRATSSAATRPTAIPRCRSIRPATAACACRSPTRWHVPLDPQRRRRRRLLPRDRSCAAPARGCRAVVASAAPAHEARQESEPEAVRASGQQRGDPAFHPAGCPTRCPRTGCSSASSTSSMVARTPACSAAGRLRRRRAGIDRLRQPPPAGGRGTAQVVHREQGEPGEHDQGLSRHQ